MPSVQHYSYGGKCNNLIQTRSAILTLTCLSILYQVHIFLRSISSSPLLFHCSSLYIWPQRSGSCQRWQVSISGKKGRMHSYQLSNCLVITTHSKKMKSNSLTLQIKLPVQNSQKNLSFPFQVVSILWKIVTQGSIRKLLFIHDTGRKCQTLQLL